MLVEPFAARTVPVTNLPAPAPSPCQNISTAQGAGKRDGFARRFGSRGGGGVRFGPEGVTLAAKAIEPFVARAIRLYEQAPGEVSASARFGSSERRRVGWAGAGRNSPEISTPRPGHSRAITAPRWRRKFS